MASPGVLEKRFLEAFETYNEPLFRHCMFRISDRERALDLVQDTYMRAWKQVSEGADIRDFKPFLYTIMHNLIIDEYRKRKAVSLDALLELENVTEGSFEELREDSAERLIDVLDAQRIQEYIEELPEQYRQAIIWRYIDEMTPKEIAEITGESENVISVRVYRALKKLKDLVTSHEQVA